MKTIGVETVIVIGDAPHAKTIVPPVVAAACSAAGVQLPGVPFPTTVVGDETSARAGAVQTAGGAPPSKVVWVPCPVSEHEQPTSEEMPRTRR